MRERPILFLALVPLVAASPPATDPAALLAGAFDNKAQFTAAPEALKRPPAAGAPYPWIDHQHARFVPVDVPAVAGPGARAIHVEWRTGGPDGPVSRRRLWVFRTAPDGSPRMDFHAFRSPEGVPADPARLAALVPADLLSYGEACALAVVSGPRGFTASIPETCTIVARSGRRMRLAATISLDGKSLHYAEAGLLPDGSHAFLVPGGGEYRFLRTSD